MRRRDLAVAVSLASLSIALGAVFSLGGLGVIPASDLRGLAGSVLKNTFNPWSPNLTAYSLNAVAAVMWDYRALDTILETAVLFAAIAGIATLFRGIREPPSFRLRGLTLVVKASTRVVIPLIIVAGISLAIHGHLSPGGGFQGGALLAVAPALVVTVFSVGAIYVAGIRARTLLKARYLALLLIVLTSIAIPIAATILGARGYVLQNMGKADAPLSMPAWFFNTPLAGSIFVFNLLELIAVSIGLTYCLLLMSARMEDIRDSLAGDSVYE